MVSGQDADQSRALNTTQQVARFERLQAELRDSVALLDSADFRDWLSCSGSYFAQGLGNRAGNVVRLLKVAGNGNAFAKSGAYFASRKGNLVKHLKNDVRSFYSAAADKFSGLGTSSKHLYLRFRANPKEMAPELMTAILISLLVSGGPDGNGGAPDLDLIVGIDAHRSILSHSIIMGSAIEAAIMSVLHLVKLVHHKLPAGHDPWWESAMRLSERVSSAAILGNNMGMAYHLFVDGIVQPGAYHDLPVSMSMEGHQVIMTGNAVAEIGEVIRKSRDAAATNGGSTFGVQPKELVKSNVTPLLVDQVVEARAESVPQSTTTRRTQEESAARLMTSATNSDWKSLHRAYLEKAFPIAPIVADAMDTKHLAIVRRFGQWFLALEDDILEACTEEQKRFVAVARGQLEPISAHEAAWRAYRETLQSLALD